MKHIALAILLLATIYIASAMEINLNDVWYNKSVSEFKNGSYSQALQNINKSLQQNPNDDAYWNPKVLIFLEMVKCLG
jgi:tetratricopeptide (TPR) repeat protein